LSTQRPTVFISATSADLKTCRGQIKEALLTLGCLPIEQSNFPPAASSVKDMLREKIATCNAVIHVAGEVYGAEPVNYDDGQARRSYTQLEYDIAKELGKPLYVFICGAEFTSDPHEEESSDKVELQKIHREALQNGDHLFTKVISQSDLALKVHQLQTRVEQLGQDLKRSQSWIGRGIAIGIVMMILIAGGLYMIKQTGEESAHSLAIIQSELEQQRAYVKSIADVFTQQKSELEKLKLTKEEKFDRALSRVAADANIDKAGLKSSIEHFITTIKANPKAGFYDQALVEFAQQNFKLASQKAGEAVLAARKERLSAEKLILTAKELVHTARTQESEALVLQGKSLYSDNQFGEAVESFKLALELIQPSTRSWAEIQYHLSMALQKRSLNAEGEEIEKGFIASIMAIKKALTYYNKVEFPLQWANSKRVHADVLSNQSSYKEGELSKALLLESIRLYEESLSVLTKAEYSKSWAKTTSNVARRLGILARFEVDEQAKILLNQPIKLYRDALTVFTREHLPQYWASVTSNLALTLTYQAYYETGEQAKILLNQSIELNRDALTVYTQEHLPLDWARTTTNTASALSKLADMEEGDQAKVLINQSLQRYRDALSVYTREDSPQDWAWVTENLARSLSDLAAFETGEQAKILLNQSIELNRDALLVYTREYSPQDWAWGTNNLAVTLVEFGRTHKPSSAINIYNEAIDLAKNALTVHSLQDFPSDYAYAQDTLGQAYYFKGLLLAGEAQKNLLAKAKSAFSASIDTVEYSPQELVELKLWLEDIENKLKP